MFSDQIALRKLLLRGSAVKRGSPKGTFVVAGLLGSFMAREAFGQSEIVQNGKTFELAADVGFELIESGAARVTDALGQVLEIAPEHFVIQDGQLYLLNTMYSAVGGQIMAVGDAIAASLMGLGVLGAAAGAGGATSPTETFSRPPSGVEKVYEDGALKGGEGTTTEISGTSLGDVFDLGSGVGAGDPATGKGGGTVNVSTGDGKDYVELGYGTGSGEDGADGGTVNVSTGGDEDVVVVARAGLAGEGAIGGKLNIDTGEANDRVTFEEYPGRGSGVDAVGGDISIKLGAGEDFLEIEFGLGQSFGGGTGGTLLVDGGSGNDHLDIGSGTARAIPGGNNAPATGGNVTVNGGEGSDKILFGKYVAGGKKGTNEGGKVVVDAGQGDDEVSFGAYTAVGELEDAIGGEVEVLLGTGADLLSFGDELADATGNAKAGKVSIDLGDDTDADTLTFAGKVGDSKFDEVVTIQNFKEEDKIVISGHSDVDDIDITSMADGVLVKSNSGTFVEFTISGTNVTTAYEEQVVDGAVQIVWADILI